MDKINILIFTLLYSLTLGTIGYYLRSVHKEVKQLIKELTDYTNELKQIVVGIQTQINKSIETDIEELKADVKTLYRKVNQNQNN